jgi:hypothetical protein
MSLGSCRIGADLVVAFDITAGSISGTPTAKIVRVAREDPGAISGTGITMNVTQRSSSDASPAGLILTLPGAQTAALLPGICAIDIKVVGGDGSISITDCPAFITMIPAVS